MSNSFYHKDLTDAQWNRIKFVFEVAKRVGRPSLNPRMVLNGILWILKSGGRWRDLPARYGNWNSIYHKFRLWCRLGLFERLLKIINAGTKDTTLLELDSTFCKVHQSACSALKDEAIGSSRGGKNTKVHVLINERMQLLNMILTGGQVHDSEAAVALLKGIKLKGKKILADKAYSSEQIRFFIAEHEAIACIPDKANFRIKHAFDSELYKQRNIVERFFQRIKNYRHIATRYDKLAVCFENFLLLAASVIHF